MDAARLHRLARKLREVALEVTSNEGEERVSAGELAIVEDVAYNSGASVGEIAKRTGLAQSLVSRTVSEMREAGVFVTRVDPADRRRSTVEIESQDRLRLFQERGVRSVDAELAKALPGVDEEKLQRVISCLEEVADLFEESRKRS